MKKKGKSGNENGKSGIIREKAASGIWSGTVSFSLVAIPVRLVKAVEPGRISFRLLHDKDYSPLERKMICPEDGSMVPPEEIVRGFEIEPGRHITVTAEELESVSPERSRTIEIAEFVDAAEVDPVYYDHPYYLVPLKGGEKAYVLLAEAMKRTGKAGVAKFVLDEREYLVLVRNRSGVLGLSTLHYSDEILSEVRTADGNGRITDEEKDAIIRGVAEMSGSFAPEKYSDERRERLLDVLRKKIAKKREVEAPETDEEKASESMTDLMEALQESMRKMKKRG